MDIRCRKCGEPWDIFEVTDAAEVLKVTPKRAHELFRKYGCGFFDVAYDYEPRVRDMRVCNTEPLGDMTAYNALAELMGDDVDGLAATAEDFGL